MYVTGYNPHFIPARCQDMTSYDRFMMLNLFLLRSTLSWRGLHRASSRLLRSTKISFIYGVT